MRTKTILGVAAVSLGAALAFTSTAQANGRPYRQPSPQAQAGGAFAGHGHAARAHAPRAFAPRAYAPRAYAPQAFAPRAFAQRAFAQRAFAPRAYAPRAAVRYGYRPHHRGWSAGYGAASYGYAQPAYGYAQPAYAPSYAQPATRSWQRTYAVPTTVYQPVTQTSYVPVTSYRAVQSTSYVPTTAYRQVTQTCSCTIDGVTTQVPCADGSAGYVGGASIRYNRSGLFTSGW